MQKESIQSLGGKARAESLTAEEKSDIAKKAAETRWAIPKASHEGFVPLGNNKISCAVLMDEDNTRVLTQEGFLLALGRARKAKGGTGATVDGVVPFLSADNLKPFITKELEESTRPIKFRTINGNPAFGFKAELLPQVCEVYLEARSANKLHPSQLNAAASAEKIIRGLARVGITGLVDEATGFQDVRDRQALAKILETYLLKEGHRKWERMFQLEYYRELFRLLGWSFDPNSTARPSYLGKVTNNIVYDRMQPGLLKKLNELNPKDSKGNRKLRNPQLFTGDVGIPELKEHLSNLIFLMKASKNYAEFIDFLDRAKPRVGDTLKLNM